MGRLQRTKQGAPEPLAGDSRHPHSGEYVGKKKSFLEARAARDGTTVSARGRGRGGRKDSKGRVTGGFMSGRSSGGQEGAKKVKKPKKAAQESEDQDEDDIEGLEEQDDYEDEDEIFGDGEDKGLEAARSALFGAADLAPPTADSNNDLDRESDDEGVELEDDFGLEEEDADEGVTLDEYELGEEEPELVMTGRAAKRAARKVYNSDDEGEMAVPGPAAEPEAVEGQEEDATMSELGADSDDDLEEGTLTDLRAVERRMRSSARVLGNWKEFGASCGKSRSDLVEQLIGDVCQYHGYAPFLAEKFFDLFGVDEALAFFTSSDTPRPLTLRVNTLKTRRRDLAQALINRGVNLEPLEGGWSKVGLQVFSGGGVPVGATPEYLAGHYILQAASSFLPVIALAPQPHERVLDMAAAPGGKTTYMSALMGNTGEVWANDSSRGRIKGLAGNVARLGCKNVIITNVDGREFPKIIGGFDRVLLDAPCSGTGVISKDQSVKTNKSERDFTLLSHLQKQLILSAIDSVSPNSATGGYVVYSTCSVMTDENEAVVSYALRKRPHVKLVETGLAFGSEGFQRFRGKEFGKNMTMTRRYYPHRENVDGFFVAKLKVGKAAKKSEDDEEQTERYVPLGDEDASGGEEGAFDDEEDKKLIDESKRKFLKSKGIKVSTTPRVPKSEAGGK